MPNTSLQKDCADNDVIFIKNEIVVESIETLSQKETPYSPTSPQPSPNTAPFTDSLPLANSVDDQKTNAVPEMVETSTQTDPFG